MGRMATYFGLSLCVFVFYHSMDKVHLWLTLYQDEKQERMEKEMEMKRLKEEQSKHKDSLA